MTLILASSLIKKAHNHAKSSPLGTKLNTCMSDMATMWCGLVTLHQVLAKILAFNWFWAPKFVIIYAGRNDIGLVSCIFLRESIEVTLLYMHILTPNTIIWSCILPRLKWRHSDNTTAIEWVQMWINRKFISSYSKSYCMAILHPDFQDKTPSLFKDDCHLSFIGNDIFLNTLQCALETFINIP